jgi:hypothetical protein
MHGVRTSDRPLTGLGETEEQHLSLAHKIGHRADDVLDRHGRVDTVLIEQVDVIGLQPTQRAFDDFANMPRPAVHPGRDVVRVEFEAELGGDDHAVSPARELLERGQQLFVL